MSELFPLRLVPLERHLLLEERPGHPMQFFCRLRFSGVLQRAPFDAALKTTLVRHPLLAAIVQGDGNRRDAWVPSPMPPEVAWLEQEPAEPLPGASAINIHREPGLRLSVIVGKARSDLVAQFHHLPCDGAGAFDFLSDLLTAYAAEAQGNVPRLRPLEPERLRHRGHFGLTFGKRLRRTFRDGAALRQFPQFFLRRPATLFEANRFDQRPLPSEYPASIFHHFSQSDTAALGRAAAALHTTLNTLLTRDLFTAALRWRQKQGVSRDEDWLRLTLPLNLRDVADRRTPATNLIGVASIDRQAHEIANRQALLASLHAQMEAIKREERMLSFIRGLRWLQSLPKYYKQHVRRPRAWATTLLTNVGPALPNCHLPRKEGCFDFAGLRLNAVEFLPVTRHLHGVTYAVTTYSGRLTLGLHYDPRIVTAVTARAFLDEYLGCIDASVNDVAFVERQESPSDREDKALKCAG